MGNVETIKKLITDAGYEFDGLDGYGCRADGKAYYKMEEPIGKISFRTEEDKYKELGIFKKKPKATEEPIPDSAMYSKVNLLNCDDPIMLRKEVIASHRVVVDLKEENNKLREDVKRLQEGEQKSSLAGEVNDILHGNTEAYRKRNETLGEDCDIATTLNCVLQEEVNKLRETVKENKQFKEDYKMIAGKYDVAFNEIARLKKQVERLQATIVEMDVRQKVRIHQLAREMIIPIGDNRSIKVSFEEINE